MRVQYILSEAGVGLRRNFTMALAVVMTMWVSLTLLGASFLAVQQVELIKGRWYDKVEISVFLCGTVSPPSDTCAATTDGTVEATAEQKATIEATLRSNPEVAEIFFETKEQAYADFRADYANSSVLETLSVEQMQESFRVKLVDPERYEGVVTQVAGLPGVQAVQDSRQYLEPLFAWANGIQVVTALASILLLMSAALQISNAIKLAAHSRRREIEIMRAVGASSSYVMLPFLLEALVTTVAGVVLAGATLAGGVYLISLRNTQGLLQAFQVVGWSETGFALLGVALTGVCLAIIPTVVTMRKYLAI